MPDAEVCETLVLTYWEKIAQIIFSEHGAALMCNHIDPQCEIPSMRWVVYEYFSNYFKNVYVCITCIIQINRAWDLDTCIATTSSMLRTLISPDVATAIVDLLKGERFCQDPSMAFTEDETAECQEIVTQFMPRVMKALFSRSDPRQLCCFYFDGLCG